MKCGGKGIDTAPEIIREGCELMYFPNESGSGKPCKFFSMCQKQMKRLIETEAEPMKLHKYYLEGYDCGRIESV